MNKVIFKRAVCLLLSAAALLLSLSACSREDFNMFFGIDKMPQNIDPQKASSYSELLTVRNCFKGLTKLIPGGDAQLDIAAAYTVSDDGLLYTFTLKDGLTWSDKTAVTADDFVFAFERASDPDTKAPQAELLKNIASVSADGGLTVIFRLKVADQNFLARLTNPVFMPCSRAFFEKCGGKYGLSQKDIITNGDFRVRSWSDGSFIRLVRVTEGPKKLSVANSVYLSVSTKGKDCVSRAIDKEVGMTVDSGSFIYSKDISSLSSSSEYRTTYAVVFNKDTAVGANKNITDAFATAVHREYYMSRCDSAIKNAGSVFSDDGTVLGKDISELITIPGYTFDYDPEAARSGFLKGVSELNKKTFPSVEILAVDDPASRAVLNDVVSKWQSDLGAYVNIKTVKDKDTLMSLVSKGDYTMAFIPMPADAVETARTLSAGGSAYIGNQELDAAVSKIDDTKSTDEILSHINDTAVILSKTSQVIPIISTPTTLLWDKKYQNITYFKTDMTVDFSEIYKTN